MANLPDMTKHRGFPSRMPGTEHQFTIRRANKGGAVALVARERYKDRRAPDRAADAAFMKALWEHFGEEPFERGNLDAGRLSWVIGREVIYASDPFDAQDYFQLLQINLPKAEANFPEMFE